MTVTVYVPRDASACPQCGVFAQMVAPRSPGRIWPWLALALVLVLAAAAVSVVKMRRPAEAGPHPARIVPKLPVSEHDAVLLLRQSFALKPECIAIISKGLSGGVYNFVAVNRCDATRLGRWRVDRKSGAVFRAAIGH